jgi:hypothetical protein
LLHPIIFDRKNTIIKQFYNYSNYSIGRAVLALENNFFLKFYRPPLIKWSEVLNISVKRLAIIQASRKNYVQHSLLFVRLNKWKEKRREKVKRKRLEEKFSPLAGDLLSVKGILTLLLSICILTIYGLMFK